MRGWSVALGAVVCATSACGAQTYVCQSSDQCNGGQCQASGFCSFPDPDCESGQRYGKFAGDGLGGQCVMPDAGTGSTSGSETTTTEPVDLSTSSTTFPLGSSSGPEASTGAIGDGTTSSISTTDAASSSSTGAVGVDPDLVAWWRLDNDPSNGAQDATPNQLDGTCVVCPASVPAIHGDGFAFTGNEVITVNEPEPFATETFTVAAWARVSGVAMATSYHHIVTKPVGTGTRNSWEIIIANTTALRLQFVVSNPTQGRVLSVVAPEFDTWFHVAGTYDGSMVRLYIDGEEQDQAAGPTDGVGWDDNPVVIGGDIDSRVLTTSFTGDIDDIRVYSRALDAAEIAELAILP